MTELLNDEARAAALSWIAADDACSGSESAAASVQALVAFVCAASDAGRHIWENGKAVADRMFPEPSHWDDPSDPHFDNVDCFGEPS